ncbi:T9SS type A sorting domain-containing protein [Chryseobacterium gwangjuense]|uniref:T9SS type A sorting domain-containing protein n=1 Tax=Chryseobacterium gwangjuense TaxID=1069980 RepID=UPI001E635C97|nr:T9SS type A sorting domain-containing protein [Chryseobacterium gwangjuense]MCE3074382.1 T9SS type A sorting domain-containing protein [Chryseobacterium gwangjuense]
MKKNLSALFFGISVAAFAQLQVFTLDITANDLVYDSNTNKIYASIPSANGANGNSIGIINPNTITLENTVFMGSEPTFLAISDNGQYIYSGFSGASIVRRFDVGTQTAGLQFTLGADPSNGPFYVEDIEVMPGQPGTIAVSRRNVGFSPRHEGVGIYDNGVMRAITTPDHTGSNKIEFTGPNALIGYNNESTEFGIRRLSINSSGVTNLGVTQSVLNNFYLDFIYHDNRMYSIDGKVVDATAAPFVIGQFSNVYGPAAFDTYYNKVAYASYDSSGNITFKRFNPNTFLLTDSLPISQAFGTVKSLITCGNGCYAFSSTGNKVVIIKDATLAVSEAVSKPKLTIYPNPTSDFINIKSDIEIKEAVVYELSGKSVSRSTNQNNRIDIKHVPSGVYILKIIDAKGNISTEKIIKK